MLSKPSLFAKIYNHAKENRNNYQPYQQIAEFPLKFGHVQKIHSVNTGNESQRDKYGCNDCKGFHYLIHPVSLYRKKEI
jgi:hypothetical protein